MDEHIKTEIKEHIRELIRGYLKNRKLETYHILDHIFPKERRISSLIGGLQTSLGTGVWEWTAKKIALSNGFNIITEKILKPEPFPLELRTVLEDLISKRENKDKIKTEDCINKLKDAASKNDPANIISYGKPPSGTGVDIHFLKDGIEYVFDIKTTQSNLGDFKKFNRQLLEWYAYRFAKNPNANFKARIAIPFNPFLKPWYEEQKSKLYPLDITQDIWVENEFWDFCSGTENTFEELKSLFVELGQEDFAKEFNDIFDPK
ncbi:TdeIII family type II restriction endonuclease [Aphanizomenon sp. CS-733/32]|uniref:TdeIII family type II restriction endonuclease n=1 Tax=Aphanizomenon sp. CS-733/32 TaxID=3021715 RepID=UPI00232EF86C|nr:TdeIII family type II restriction endonuclease [Aphanizomenon sp. CS-733/32]MDB9311208.1 TdeIII family type II restriction endonuclease [Aphanizomenon sp. CS-733/32]